MMNDEAIEGGPPLPMPMDEEGGLQIGDFDSQKAEQTRKKKRKRCMIGGAVVLSLAVILAIVLGATLSSSSSETEASNGNAAAVPAGDGNGSSSGDTSSSGDVIGDEELIKIDDPQSNAVGSYDSGEAQQSDNNAVIGDGELVKIDEDEAVGEPQQSNAEGSDEVGAPDIIYDESSSEEDQSDNDSASDGEWMMTIEDDAATISAGAAMVDINVLDNDDAPDGKALNVHKITRDGEFGNCFVSVDLMYIAYVPNDSNVVEDDECAYEACLDGEDELCGEATVKIAVEGGEDPAGEGGEESGSQLPEESITSISLELVPANTNDIFVGDTVVAIHGNTAIAGSQNDNDWKGAVLVYGKDVDTGMWKQEGKLSPPGNVQYTGFGSSLAIFENWIVVGASQVSNEDAEIYFLGAAYVYRKVDDTWLYQATLLARDGKENDYFGYDVAIYEGTVVVGAWYWQDDAPDSGSAYVFARDAEDKWTQQAKLESPDGGYDSFGNSVAIYENTVVVSAWRTDNAETDAADSGAAHVFVRDVLAGTWVHEAKLVDDVGEAKDRFGNTVAIYEDTVVVGARGDDGEGSDGELVQLEDSGAAYVFKRDDSGDAWSRMAKLVAPDSSVGDQFGNSVAIYDDVIVVGARFDDDNEDNSGSAHVYALYMGNQWKHTSKLIAPEGEEDDFFAYSVAVHDGTVVVGSKSGETHLFADAATSGN